jgi:hypothetical protein
MEVYAYLLTPGLALVAILYAIAFDALTSPLGD